MSRLILVAALLVACTAPPTAPLSSSPTPTANVAVPPTSSPLPSPAFRDLKVAPAGDVRGDHVLVMQLSSVGGAASNVVLLDVAVDGGATKELVSYTRTPSLYTDYDVVSLSRQLSADGGRLVLSDPDEVAGTGLVIVDLVAGTARRIPLVGLSNEPAWSPDGQTIAYRGASIPSVVQQDTGVWVVSATGGDARLLAPSELPGGGATQIYGWTEDGRGVIYGPTVAKLNVVDVASGAVTQIGGALAGGFPIAVRDKRPSMAVVFDESVRDSIVGNVEVRQTATVGGTVVARYGPKEGTFLSDPRWRPGADEVLLLWASGQGVAERDELVIVDGVTATRRVIATPQAVRSADWTTDGRRIVYASLQEVRVRDADGSNDRLLFRPASPGANGYALVTRLAVFAPR